MSNLQRIALGGGLLLAALALYSATKVDPPAPANADDAQPSGTPAAESAPAAASPDGKLKPGEVRPGEKPGTLVVQPFQPGGPKTISANYRVPSHRDDARITRGDDAG